MTRSIEARLTALERSFAQSGWELSEADLLEAIESRRLDKAHLLALYRRIEKPYAASVLTIAWALKSEYLEMTASERDAFPEIHSQVGRIAAHLAWPAHDPPPPRLGGTEDPSTWPAPSPPSAEDREPFWGMRVRYWLARHFLAVRGRQALRSQIASYVEAGRIDDGVVPTLADDERDRLLDLVDSLENPEFPDIPVLSWYDLEGQLCASRKPFAMDKSGQRWTHLRVRRSFDARAG